MHVRGVCVSCIGVTEQDIAQWLMKPTRRSSLEQIFNTNEPDVGALLAADVVLLGGGNGDSDCYSPLAPKVEHGNCQAPILSCVAGM